MKKIQKRILLSMTLIAGMYSLLLIPDFDTEQVAYPDSKPFVWNRDSLWNKLETNFSNARQTDDHILDSEIVSLLAKENGLFDSVMTMNITATDPVFDKITDNFFSLSVLIASHPKYKDQFIKFYNKVRTDLKGRSLQWDINNFAVRNSLYKVLYGMRAAVEEVLLQTEKDSSADILLCRNESSVTLTTDIFGIEVHSGDLLVSRGGAEVSAFISRGNDYPGNFSHVALIYIDTATKIPYLIEAHIEKGVAVSTVDNYIKDKKLRFMVMRPRADLRQMKADPQLPQKAAEFAYNLAIKNHIPYDFKMNYYDSSAMFCSEVGSYAYKKSGIQLWKGVSTISSQGVVNWLHAFGVENFVTQMPSDLEYDPQLSVVAEWHDNETLFKDHIDNAVMDALLEQANKGIKIRYNFWKLPLARVIKAYCVVRNYFGGIGVIPEGMSATQALKNQQFEKMFQQVKSKMQADVNNFILIKKYKPPYWQLIKMSNKAAEFYFTVK